jgi:hypothetical protein
MNFFASVMATEDATTLTFQMMQQMVSEWFKSNQF